MTKRQRRWLAMLTAGAAAGVLVRRASKTTFATDDDPCGPEGIALPEGQRSTLTTDDGATLAVLTAGPVDGPVVVLAHCWTGGMSLWGAVARRLVASGHRVVLWDQRGHGDSTLGTDLITVDRLGDDLHQILNDLDLRDVVLAGHSMGGMTIQALASRQPDDIHARVRGIALVATAAHTGRLKVPPRIANAMLGEHRTVRLAKRGATSVRGAVGKNVYEPHLVATHEALLATTGEARAGFMVAMGKMDYRPALPTIEVPVRILVGTRDRLTPPGRARELAAAIPTAELRVLDGYGHMLPLEAPEVVADTINALHTAHLQTV
ncbi:MAG TPA: alpha/beta hydrolase [Acidimicrobiales bacterium]